VAERHTDTVRFSDALARARRVQGLSVRALAAKADVSFSTVSRMESGGVGFHFDHAARVAQALGYTLAEFLTAEPCGTCDGAPPAGFTCNTCGQKGDGGG
jgi:transcriptional regulator with XRE-family HTH domain